MNEDFQDYLRDNKVEQERITDSDICWWCGEHHDEFYEDGPYWTCLDCAVKRYNGEI